MVEFKRGLIDKQQKGYLLSVFQRFDKDESQTLTWNQFKDFVFVIGMNFLVKHYSEEM